MALNGINLPLAFVGQEWLWQEIFTEYGLSFEEMSGFFSGPAFLPWFRMGNMRGWAGADMSSSGMQVPTASLPRPAQRSRSGGTASHRGGEC